MKERIRPFVEAKNPGAPDDPETQAFERRTKEEAEDLKLESFGTELLHAIGDTYLAKATVAIKGKKNNILGVPGFFRRLGEKGAVFKEGWGVLGSVTGAHSAMMSMASKAEKGDLAEEEMKALEAEVSGKLLLATWKGTRWEIHGVLRNGMSLQFRRLLARLYSESIVADLNIGPSTVCDQVLKEKGVPEAVLLNRAKVRIHTLNQRGAAH